MDIRPNHLTASGNPLAIVGAGTIGLAIALELRHRGFAVQVFEAAPTGLRRPGQASFAAAGMLSPGDPDRPAALRPLAEESLRQYEGFLRQLERDASTSVPFQTTETVEYADDGASTVIAERSLDPRQLHAALLTAASAAGVGLREGADVDGVTERPGEVTLSLRGEGSEAYAAVIFAGGAWLHLPTLRDIVRPRKGQMLRVRIPRGVRLDRVHRAKDVYVVPRTAGPQKGSALIGATVEDCGFDLRLDPDALADLRRRAARFVPELADASAAPELESWAGLRPCTPDALPLIGKLPGSERQFVAGGHFRDGILLAPATARSLADLIEGKATSLDLSPFDPPRFAHSRR